MPRRRKKRFFDKKNSRTYHLVSGDTLEGSILEASPEDVEVEEWATVTTKGGTRRRLRTHRVRHILGEDPYYDSYANPVQDRKLRPYLKTIGEDHRGMFVAQDGQVTPATKVVAASTRSESEALEDMGNGVKLRNDAAGGAAKPPTDPDDIENQMFLPDFSDAESDEVEYRTDAIALREAADEEVAAHLDDEFDSDAMEEFGELQDDFVQFAIAEEEKHPRLVEEEKHVKVAEDFEEKRNRLMYEAGLLDEEDIPFGFGMEEDQPVASDEEEKREPEEEEPVPDLEDHDFSDVIGAAARYRQRFIDEHFRVKMKKEYDNEDQWGEIEDEEVEGGVVKPDSEYFNELMDEFMDLPQMNQKKYCKQEDATEEDVEKSRRVALEHGMVDLPDLTEEEYFNRPKRNHWDCATIVSTYSNLENHPSVIDGDDMSSVIVLSSKTGLPLVSAKAKKKKKKRLLAKLNEGHDEDDEGSDYDSEDSDAETVMTTMSSASVSVRVKGETAKERRERKAAVKAARREARAAKKQMKNAYKKEGLRLDKAKARNAKNMGGRSQFSYSDNSSGARRR